MGVGGGMVWVMGVGDGGVSDGGGTGGVGEGRGWMVVG